MTTGWALTIAGCDRVFTTDAGVGTPTSSHPLWIGGATGVTYAHGWLVTPRGTITERAAPLSGDLDVSAQSFTLHDASDATGPLLSRLALRDEVHVSSTPLASTVTAAATSWTVGDGGVFTSPCFAWCEREAVRVTSIAGNVLTVTRGALGTKAAAHTVDASRTLYPEVFSALPWTTRRKTCLWRVDAGAAALVWVGYAVRAPTLGDDGATVTLPCDPLWTVQRQCPVGGTLGATSLVGYSDGRGRASAGNPPLLRTRWGIGSTTFTIFSNGEYRDLDQLFAHHAAAVATASTAAGSRVEAHLSRSGANSFRLDADATSACSVRLTWTTRDPILETSLTRAASRESLTVEVGDVPRSLVMVFSSIPGGTYPVTTLAGLQTSWSSTSTSEGGGTTWQQPGLRLHVSDRWSVLMLDVATSDTGELGPRFSGTHVWRPRKPLSEDPPGVLVVPNPGPLQVVYRVRAEHWALGLKHSVVGLCEDAHPDDWDWTSVYDGTSGLGTVIRATAGLRVSREWIFDGKRTLGDVVTECCLLHGCSPVTRSGRLALHVWGWPSAGETPALTIDAQDIIGKPSWSRWRDGLANRVSIKGDAIQITATQQGSRAKYGPGRAIEIDLAGVEEQTLPVDDPLAFARDVLGRMELWSEPLASVTVRLSARHVDTVELGAVLSITEWMLPDGAGSRGLSGALGVVVGRTIDLGAATVQVEALVFSRVAYPYAPCAKAASVVSSTVVQLATGYVGGTQTYSGGVDAGTFAAGDVVELLERDTTTAWREALTVASVNTGLNRVTFTGAMSATAQTKIGAGWVDLRFAPYATCQASQQTAWMFVADDATRVIDGTADAERSIAP